MMYHGIMIHCGMSKKERMLDTSQSTDTTRIILVVWHHNLFGIITCLSINYRLEPALR